MGKNFQDNQNSIVNTTDLTLKSMFDISAKLVAEQDEIPGSETIGWEKHSWKYLSLIGEERIINLQRATVYVFSYSVLCLGKIHQNPDANEAWKKRIEWITTSQSYRDFDGIIGEPTEFEWNIFDFFFFGTINAVRVCQPNHVLIPKTCTMTLTTWLANQPSREVGHPDPRVPHSLNAPMNLRTPWRKKWRASSSIASANRRKRTPATWGRPLAPDFLPTDE